MDTEEKPNKHEGMYIISYSANSDCENDPSISGENCSVDNAVDKKKYNSDGHKDEDVEKNDDATWFSTWIETMENATDKFVSSHKRLIKAGTCTALLFVYFAYFAYCMYYRFGDEGSIILLTITIALAIKVFIWILDSREIVIIKLPTSFYVYVNSTNVKRLRVIIKRLSYLAAVLSVVIYLVVSVFPQKVTNVQSFIGMFILILFCFIFSTKPSKVNWHPVFWSFVIQFVVATLTLRTELGYNVFKWLGEKMESLFGHSDAGSRLVLDKDFDKMGLAFSTSGVLIFTTALIFLLNHWGVIEFIVLKIGGFLSFCLETGPVESVVAAANIFLSLAESPMAVQPYLRTVSKSELHTIMTCGFASISGGFLGVFIRIGAPSNHLLTATVISAPAALAISKLMYPETEKDFNRKQGIVQMDTQRESNGLNAFSEGAVMGLSVAAAVWTNMLAFISILDLLDALIGWLGDRAGVDGLTFETICSYVLFPLAYAIGVGVDDCKMVASLIGIKLFTTPLISYSKLGILINNRKEFEAYTSSSINNTWQWNDGDIILKGSNTTLVNGILSERSEVIATYAMCGLSAVTAIGVTIAVLTSLCPPRKHDVVNLVTRAFIAGNLASFATGAVAGVLF